MDAPAPGGLGGTYAGNPLAVVAALEVVKIIRDENLLERSVILGERLQKRLNELATEIPEIAEVRGLGSMVAVEFRDPGTDAPLPELVRQIQARALDHGLLLLSCGVDGNVIRFLFPLTTPDTVLQEGLDLMARAMRGI
jgi:4-aminobutyrate aminotransferase/(S)-3-amino-2-methylpropionate transaminase